MTVAVVALFPMGIVQLTPAIAETQFDAGDTGFFAYHFGTVVRIELTAPHGFGADALDHVVDIIHRRTMLADYMVPVCNDGVLSRMGRDMVSLAHRGTDSDKVVNAYGRLVELLD